MSRMLMKTMLNQLHKERYTDTRIAEIVGVSQTCISSIRRGKSKPIQKTLAKFWEAAERHAWKERFVNGAGVAPDGDPPPETTQGEIFAGPDTDSMTDRMFHEVVNIKNIIRGYGDVIKRIDITTEKGLMFTAAQPKE